jgi:hypothetical protein
VVEASNRRALARAIQGLSIRVAKGLNRMMGRTGRVFDDRYHARSDPTLTVDRRHPAGALAADPRPPPHSTSRHRPPAVLSGAANRAHALSRPDRERLRRDVCSLPARYPVAVLVWLLWLLCLLALVVAAVLLVWALLIGVVVVGGMASTELCPRCGLSLGITESDRFLDDHLDARYGSGASDSCFQCGWRRSDDRV